MKIGSDDDGEGRSDEDEWRGEGAMRMNGQVEEW